MTNPYLSLALAAERSRELQQAAAPSRLAALARRSGGLPRSAAALRRAAAAISARDAGCRCDMACGAAARAGGGR